MALHFVSTAVLSSSDGIAFETEVKTDSEEVRKAKAKAAAAHSKPLYEQLEAIKQKQQEEYDAMTKLIFGRLITYHQYWHKHSANLNSQQLLLVQLTKKMNNSFKHLLTHKIRKKK